MSEPDLTHRDLHDDLIKNKIDIELIKHSIHTIETNHLAHIQDSVENLENRVEKIDNRVWAILIAIIVTGVIPILLEYI
jgi:hypothetical protein